MLGMDDMDDMDEMDEDGACPSSSSPLFSPRR